METEAVVPDEGAENKEGAERTAASGAAPSTASGPTPSVGSAAGRGPVRGLAFWIASVLLLVILPLAFSWQTAATFYTPKLLPLYVGAALAVLAATRMGNGSVGGSQGVPGLRLGVPEVLAAGFLLWGLVSLVASPSSWTSLLGIYNQGTGWLFWLAALAAWTSFRRMGVDDSTGRKLLGLAVLAGAVVAILAFLQVLEWEPLRMRMGFSGGGRPGSTFGNPLYLSAYLSVVLVAGLELLRRGQSRVARVAAALGTVAIVFGLVLALSRGAWLGALAGIAVWGHLAWRAEREWRYRVGAGLGVVMVAAVVAALLIPGLSSDRLEVGDRFSPEAGAGRTVGTRLLMWEVAVRAAADRPLLGWGPNNYRDGAQQHMLAEKLEAEPQSRDADAHNLVLEIGAGWGIPGLLLLLAWFAALGWLVWRGRPWSRGSASLAGGVLAALFVSSLTMPFNLGVLPVALLLVGAAGGTGESVSGDARSAVGERALLRLSPRAGEGVRLVIFTGGLIWLALAVVGGAQAYRADAAFQEAVITSSLAKYESAVDTYPLVDHYWFTAGMRRAREGFDTGNNALVEEGVRQVEKGLGLAPRSIDGLETLATIYLQRGDWSEVLRVSRRTISYAPTEPQPRVQYSYALAKTGNPEKALAQVRQALEVDVRSPMVLYEAGLTYRELGRNDRARELFQAALEIYPDLGPAQLALDTLPAPND